MEKYINIKENNFLKIKVSHRAGGDNVFHGTTEKRGVQVSFTSIEKDGYVERFVPMDGVNFRILALEYKRKSQKKIKLVEDFVEKNTKELFELWKNRDKDSIIRKFETFRDQIN